MSGGSQAVRARMRRAIESGAFPGGQVAVQSPELRLAFADGRTGLAEYPQSQPVTDDTFFDIASLTKALSTSVLLMQAVDRLDIDLAAPIKAYFPALPGADRITLGLLAGHRGGLIDHAPFYRSLFDQSVPPGDTARSALLQHLGEMALDSVPGSKTLYSDPGYILLGWVIERRFGSPLDVLFRQQIAEPLGLERTGYGPVEQPVAATEPDERGAMLWGRVHDENARALGGVEGHAGLFSTAAEVASIVCHLAAVHGGASGIVSTEVVRRFWKADNGRRFTAGGWDTPTEPSSSGRYMTRGATVGHLGFTGCSVWHDVPRQVTIVLLTNRVHPTRENDAIRAFRPLFHDTVHEALFE